MNDRWDRIARAITSFVENPVTNLVKGLVLLMIGLTEAAHTFREDVTHGHVRVGHGIIIIGVFSILEALPHHRGLDAAGNSWNTRGRAGTARNGQTMSEQRRIPSIPANLRSGPAWRATGPARPGPDDSRLGQDDLAMASFGFGMVAFFRTIQEQSPSPRPFGCTGARFASARHCSSSGSPAVLAVVHWFTPQAPAR